MVAGFERQNTCVIIVYEDFIVSSIPPGLQVFVSYICSAMRAWISVLFLFSHEPRSYVLEPTFGCLSHTLISNHDNFKVLKSETLLGGWVGGWVGWAAVLCRAAPGKKISLNFDEQKTEKPLNWNKKLSRNIAWAKSNEFLKCF